MKKVFLASLLGFSALNFLFAQEFSFEMYFEDSAGNQDTVVLGYDALGTVYIDSAFAEQDILYGPKKNGLDVRIVQYIFNPTTEDTIATKTQILPLNCDNAWPYLKSSIEITTNNWPVTASWDNTLFADSCRLTSLFTSIHPGGWFDTGSPSNLFIAICKDENAVNFTSQVDHYNGSASINENYAYLDALGDTVSMFWYTFNYDFSSGIAFQPLDVNFITVFPNPSFDRLYFTNFEEMLSIKCFAADGRQIELTIERDWADVSTLPTGVYFLQLNVEKGRQITKRFVKQ